MVQTRSQRAAAARKPPSAPRRRRSLVRPAPARRVTRASRKIGCAAAARTLANCRWH